MNTGTDVNDHDSTRMGCCNTKVPIEQASKYQNASPTSGQAAPPGPMGYWCAPTSSQLHRRHGHGSPDGSSPRFPQWDAEAATGTYLADPQRAQSVRVRV